MVVATNTWTLFGSYIRVYSGGRFYMTREAYDTMGQPEAIVFGKYGRQVVAVHSGKKGDAGSRSVGSGRSGVCPKEIEKGEYKLVPLSSKDDNRVWELEKKVDEG